MIGNYPPILKKSALALIVGLLVLMLSLAVSSPISYLITIGAGSFGILLALLGYMYWFVKQLKSPN